MKRLERVFPFLGWLGDTDSESLRADFVAGVTVAMVLIPQSMAYAQLAGLPAYYGLYTAFLAPTVAALFGSSRQLATGPVAVVSLFTAAILEPLATAGSEQYAAYAILLSLIVGIFQLAMGLLRLGAVVNFLAHPVVVGFTNAAAIIIATSQLAKLLGVEVESSEHHYETVLEVVKQALRTGHAPTLAFGALGFAIMLVLRRISPRIPNVLVAVAFTSILSWAVGFEAHEKVPLSRILAPAIAPHVSALNAQLAKLTELKEKRRLAGRKLDETIARAGLDSLEAVGANNEIMLVKLQADKLTVELRFLRHTLRAARLVRGTAPDGSTGFFAESQVPAPFQSDGRVWRLRVGNKALPEDALVLTSGGAVVGSIPAGLPRLSLPAVDSGLALKLFSSAVVMALLGFMEAISIAKAMATRTGQRIDPNQELIGQGLACIASSVSSGYSVSGSFSRSAVNLQAGARTGLSSVFTSLIVMVTLLFLTPLLYYLPESVLAAIIMMAVVGLVNVGSFVHAWKVQPHDGIVALVSFVATLAFAPNLDEGILIGVVLSITFYLYRSMKPEVGVLSKHPDGSYRRAEVHALEQCRHLAAVRFTGSLIFANANLLEKAVLERVAAMPGLRHVLIVGNGINEMDASGEEVLSHLVDYLRDAGYELSLSGLNDALLEVMGRTHLLDKIGRANLYRNVASALAAIHARAHVGGREKRCPLLEVCPRGTAGPDV